MENRQFRCRVGSTPTLEVALLVTPELFGAGIKGRRLAEVALKQDEGMALPGHCWPGAGALQPAGATKPCGTKIGLLNCPPISAGVGTVNVDWSAKFKRNQSALTWKKVLFFP